MFGVVGLTIIGVLLLSHGADAAIWFSVRWGGLLIFLLAVTGLRQRHNTRAD